MHHLSSVALAVSLTTAIAAQEAVRRPSFVLAAGRHSATALIEQVGQVRKIPIKTDPELRDALAERSVHVPVELRLTTVDFDVVATNVLLHEGVLLVAEAGALRPVLLARCQFRDEAFDAREPLGAMAVDRTPEQVLAGTRGIELVRTRVSLREMAPQKARMMLRIMAPRAPQRPGLESEAGEGELMITGTTDEVAFAVRLLRALEGQEAAAEPAAAIDWSTDGTLRWPGGELPRAAFDRLVVTTLDANVLGAGAIPDDEMLDLGAPAELSAAEWFARATAVYHEHELALLPVVPGHRVFVLLRADGQRRSEIVMRARYVAQDQLDGGGAVLPIMTAFALQHVDVVTATNQLRAAGVPLEVQISNCGGGALLLTGMRQQVAKVMAKLRLIDRP